MSGAAGGVGLIFLIVGAMLMVQGAWMAVAGKTPPWMQYKSSTASRRRGFGIALIVLGLGIVLEGAGFIEPIGFAIVRGVGIALFAIGSLLVILVVRPRPSE